MLGVGLAPRAVFVPLVVTVTPAVQSKANDLYSFVWMLLRVLSFHAGDITNPTCAGAYMAERTIVSFRPSFVAPPVSSSSSDREL